MTATTMRAPARDDVIYASFAQRAFAFLIDLLWATPIALFMAWRLYGDAGMAAQTVELRLSDFYAELVVGAISIACWRRWGATPGKAFLGLRLVDGETFGPPPFLSLAMRYSVRVVYVAMLVIGGASSYWMSYPIGGAVASAAMVAVLAAYLWPIWDSRRRALHDIAADTVVIRIR